MIKNFEEVAFVVDIKEPVFFKWKIGETTQNHKLLAIYINKAGCEVGFLSMDIRNHSITSVGWDLYEEFISEGNALEGF